MLKIKDNKTSNIYIKHDKDIYKFVGEVENELKKTYYFMNDLHRPLDKFEENVKVDSEKDLLIIYANNIKENTEIIFILGANIYEEHIIDFIEKNIEAQIFCINDGEKSGIINTEKINKNAFNIIMDFNNKTYWEYLNIAFNNRVNKIIVDGSVVKFFDKMLWNFDKGFTHIYNLLQIDGEFYSECCYSSSQVELDTKEENVSRYYPNLFYYEPEADNKVIIKVEDIKNKLYDITGKDKVWNDNYVEYKNELFKLALKNNFLLKFYYLFDKNDYLYEEDDKLFEKTISWEPYPIQYWIYNNKPNFDQSIRRYIKLTKFDIL